MHTNIERPPDVADVFTIWPGSGIPPGSESWYWHEQAMQPPHSTVSNEMVRNVVVPTVTMFKPAADTASACMNKICYQIYGAIYLRIGWYH